MSTQTLRIESKPSRRKFKRLDLTITDRQRQMLEACARFHGVGKSELVRRMLDSYFRNTRRQTKRELQILDRAIAEKE